VEMEMATATVEMETVTRVARARPVRGQSMEAIPVAAARRPSR
jgi:hypothetical protein